MFDELSLPLIQKKSYINRVNFLKDDKVELLRTQTKPHKPYPNQKKKIWKFTKAIETGILLLSGDIKNYFYVFLGQLLG